MANVFNNNPSVFVDMNTLFPVLNDKVGLTSDQWKKAMENANYLYNHLGLADVEVGNITTNFTEPGTLSNVNIVHREVEVAGKMIDYFDFIFNIPTPSISSSATARTVENSEPATASVIQSPILNDDGVVVGYSFGFNFDIPKGEKGDKGDKGEKGEKGDTGDGTVVNVSGTSVEVLNFDSDPQNQINTLNTSINKKIESAFVSFTIETTDWAELADKEPYKFSATIDCSSQITTTGEAVYELINDNVVSFANYGFALNEVSFGGAGVVYHKPKFTFYAIEKPTAQVTLKVLITANTILLLSSSSETGGVVTL